jgi:hypothetical protein
MPEPWLSFVSLGLWRRDMKKSKAFDYIKAWLLFFSSRTVRGGIVGMISGNLLQLAPWCSGSSNDTLLIRSMFACQ